jgi:hypothetical protein
MRGYPLAFRRSARQHARRSPNGWPSGPVLRLRTLDDPCLGFDRALEPNVGACAVASIATTTRAR